MEYDIEIKLTKLVKNQGLAKLLTNSNCQALGLNVVFNEVSEREKTQHEKEKEKIFQKYADSVWYSDIVYFSFVSTISTRFRQREIHVLKVKSYEILYF